MTRSPRVAAYVAVRWSPARCTTTCPITSGQVVPGQMASVKSTKLEVGTRRGDDEDEDRGWQQATGTSREESGPRDGAGLPQLAHEEAGDEEAREDEEDVDPEEATR